MTTNIKRPDIAEIYGRFRAYYDNVPGDDDTKRVSALLSDIPVLCQYIQALEKAAQRATKDYWSELYELLANIPKETEK